MTSSPVLTFRQNALVSNVTNIPTNLLDVELNGEKLKGFLL